MRSEAVGRAAQILKPDHLIAVEGDRENIHVSVGIYVDGINGVGRVNARADGLRGEKGVGIAIIEVNRNRVAFSGAADDVHVAIAINILNRHGNSAINCSRNGASNEVRVRCSVVLKPVECVTAK